jgi:hypothetical protein
MNTETAGQATPRAARSARTNPASAPPTTELEVISLSEDEWRVSDPARIERDGISLVGFIKRVDGAFEVTQLGFPQEHLRFSTLAMAVSYLQWPGAGSA